MEYQLRSMLKKCGWKGEVMLHDFGVGGRGMGGQNM